MSKSFASKLIFAMFTAFTAFAAACGGGAGGGGGDTQCSVIPTSEVTSGMIQTCTQVDVSGATGEAACDPSNSSNATVSDSDCPAAGLVGCCVTTSNTNSGGGTIADCYYTAAAASAAMPSCTGSPAPGVTFAWSTTVP